MSNKTCAILIVLIFFGFLAGLGMPFASEAAGELPTEEGTTTLGDSEISIWSVPTGIHVIDFDNSGKERQSDALVVAGGGDSGSKDRHSWKGKQKRYRNRGSKEGYKSYEDSNRYKTKHSYEDSNRYKTKDSYKYSEEAKKYGHEKEGKTKGDFKESKEYKSPSNMKEGKNFDGDTEDPFQGKEGSKPAGE